MANYVVLNTIKHKDMGFLARDGWKFAEDTRAVPVLQAELGSLLPHYALAFVHASEIEGEEPITRLVAITGLGSKNLYVAPDHKWLCSYIPALLRTYPFRLAEVNDDQAICIAEEHLVSSRTLPLMDDEGQPSPLLARAIDFMLQCFQQQQITNEAVAKLADSGLIEKWPLQVSGKDQGNEPVAVEGFYRINEKALNELDAEGLHALQGAPLAIAYAQMYSSYQVRELAKRAEFVAANYKSFGDSPDLDELFAGDNDELSFGF